MGAAGVTRMVITWWQRDAPKSCSIPPLASGMSLRLLPSFERRGASSGRGTAKKVTPTGRPGL